MSKLADLQCRIVPADYHGDGKGLCLVVKPTGSRSWVLRVMHDGRAQEIGLGGYADNAKEPEKTNALWPARLESPVFKVIGTEPVAQIDVKAIRRVVRPLWHDKPETARRLFMAIAEVLDYGNGEGMCGPAPKLELVGKGLGAQPEPRNRPAVPDAEAPAVVAKLLAKDQTVGRLCQLFAALTGSRSAEARGATWNEIDLEAKIWTCPAERMKSREVHLVLLSEPALAILRQVLASQTEYPEEVRETALAHIYCSKAARAYQRDAWFEKRRPLMADWAAYMMGAPTDGAKAGGNLISLAGRKAAAKS